MTDLYIDILPLLIDDPDAEEAWLKSAIDAALSGEKVPLAALSEEQLYDLMVTRPGFRERTFNPAANSGPFAGISFARCVGAHKAYEQAMREANRLSSGTAQYDDISDELKAILPADLLMIVALKGDLGEKRDEFNRIVIKHIMAKQGYAIDG